MAQRFVDPSTLTSYGMSRQRSSFTTLQGAGEISSGEVVSGGAMMALAQDLTSSWTMYNGNPIAGNELVDSTIANPVTYINKQFFTQVSLNRPSTSNGAGSGPYSGVANFSQKNAGIDPEQHVMVFSSTDEILPNSGAVARGIDQNYRIRFELDLRPRLYYDVAGNTGDKEFSQELYQLNLRMSAQGGVQYATGNTIDETTFVPDQYHPGYTFNGTLSSGWENSSGIPNPMYGWLKVNSGTASQILNDGSITSPQLSSDGIITLENGATVDTSVVRNPGEMVDLTFEDIVISADPANSGPYYVYGTETDTNTYGNCTSVLLSSLS